MNAGPAAIEPSLSCPFERLPASERCEGIRKLAALGLKDDDVSRLTGLHAAQVRSALADAERQP